MEEIKGLEEATPYAKDSIAVMVLGPSGVGRAEIMHHMVHDKLMEKGYRVAVVDDMSNFNELALKMLDGKGKPEPGETVVVLSNEVPVMPIRNHLQHVEEIKALAIEFPSLSPADWYHKHHRRGRSRNR